MFDGHDVTLIRTIVYKVFSFKVASIWVCNSTLKCMGKEINCLHAYIYRLLDVIIVRSIRTSGVINLGWGVRYVLYGE